MTGVLVTGGRGFVGTHLQRELGDRAIVTDVDVTDSDATAAAVRLASPSAVVHLAAFASVAASDVARELTKLRLRPGYVLYVGRFDPYKNVAALVDAHRALAVDIRRMHPLVLIGDIDPAVRHSISGDPWVEAVGPVDDVDPIYRGAAVFVYPSLYEGFGLPPLEAMIREVPIVTTHHASLPEVVGNAAVLTDGSASQLADAIQTVLQDPQLRDRLVEAGKRRAALFNWGTTARAVLAEMAAVEPPTRRRRREPDRRGRKRESMGSTGTEPTTSEQKRT